jgi:hypothetical protein
MMKQTAGNDEQESFTKNRKDQNDSYRKGESPHNRDALPSKQKKTTVKDNNNIGGINIG